MVIWPTTISPNDAQWRRACALLQVLALNPRLDYSKNRYFETAEDYLIRPNIWVDRKLIPAPYYTYAVRFAVSASVHGSIPIDDELQLNVFKKAINAALHGPLTMAERRRWESNSEFLRCCYSDDAKADEFAKVMRAQGATASRHYDEARAMFQESRRHTGYKASSLCSHNEILEALVQLGATLVDGRESGAMLTTSI